jgi:hypothetical protein
VSTSVPPFPSERIVVALLPPLFVLILSGSPLTVQVAEGHRTVGAGVKDAAVGEATPPMMP